MSDESGGDRKSQAFPAEILKDPDEIAEREALNGLKQFDTAIEIIETHRDGERPFKLRVSTILTLNRIAIDGINMFAGAPRPGDVEIGGSEHHPPKAHLVPELLEEMCDYVNENWQMPAVHLAAYVMWKLNWIHPFVDGNGRTARTVSYVVLCARLGYVLPGENTIPAQISENKAPYYEVLEAADAKWAEGKIDVSELESLIGELLAAQLLGVVEEATGNIGSAP